jgi:murein DD-endopeptidase MepM/ murein hydrolase activator NlpD
VLGGCALAGRHVPPTVAEYTVVSGDTLSDIAARYRVSVEALRAANGVADPRRLQVGTVLKVPAPDGSVDLGDLIPPRNVATDSWPNGSTSPAALSPVETVDTPERANLRTRLSGIVLPVAEARLTSKFGRRFLRFHEGIDLSAPRGTEIRAALAGTVVYSGAGINGYGNTVILRHGEIVTVYAHNTTNLVARGDEVRAGERIATVGATGRASGPHCHFEIRVRDERGRFVAVDPLPYLLQRRAP